MKQTEVVNIRHAACDVYIGRAGHGEDGYFGNPFRQRIHALKGKRLGCFCKPYPCHGDIIKEYLDTLDDE